MEIFRKHPFSRRGHPPRFWLIYVLAIIFSFHGLLVAYNNSTFMEQFVTPEAVGALYTIASALAVLIFLFISRVLQRFGNVKLTLALVFVEIGALITLGTTTHPATAIIAFVAFLLLNPLLYLNLDIFSETLIGDNEGATGSRRGLTLMLMSVASVLAPLTMGYIVGDDAANIPNAYLTAACIGLVFAGLITIHFSSFTDPKYQEMKVLNALRKFWLHRDVRHVFLAHFTLQVFFSWMVIYVPLYLATQIGFTWEQIGTIIAAGLMAYVFFEYGVGYLADRYIGEQEMMACGFLILVVTSSWISFMAAAPVTAWMVLMFMSRTGASLVEVTTESYFFKHTDGSDANIISFFRLTRPLAMLLASLLGSVALLYLPFNLIFLVLGALMVPGLFFTLLLTDTK